MALDKRVSPHHAQDPSANPSADPTAGPTANPPGPSVTDPTLLLQPASPNGSRQPLHQVLALLDLDILRELERFRDWQQSQAELESCLSAPPDPEEASLPSMSRLKRHSTHLEPQDVVEDLDVEMAPRSGLVSPLSILFLWLLSCAGFGVGILWLVTPGDPNRPRIFQVSSSEAVPPEAVPPQEPPIPDLLTLPLIPVSPDDILLTEDPLQPDPDPPSDLQPQFDPDSFRVERLVLARNVLDLTQRPNSSLREGSSARSAAPLREVSQRDPVPPLRPRPVAPSTPRPQTPALSPELTSAAPVISPELQPADPIPDAQLDTSSDPGSAAPVTARSAPPSALDPDQGEGTFVVIMNYQGDDSLAQARQVSDSAFVKDINGEKYVQIASFEQLEYARYLQEDLQKQGFSVQIAPSN